MATDLSRRGLLGIAAALPLSTAAFATDNPIAGGRPPKGKRNFTSDAVERAIVRVRRQLGNEGVPGKLARLFANCFPNTLDTTVAFDAERGDTFVITGDIHAMWLRDSTAQVWPYLRFAREDPKLAALIAGVVRRQARCVLLDPYANAFNKDPTASAEWSADQTEMKRGVHERKWELDSLCSVLRLSHGYWHATGDTSPFDTRWREAMALIVRTMREQQRKAGRGPYRFQRKTDWNPDSVPVMGWGNPVKPVGLIVSLFRPSDDAAILPFLVPANCFAVVSLRQLAELQHALGMEAAAADCAILADEVYAALRAHALVEHPDAGKVWAYEVDGFGNALHLDDANVPNLLSLPYLGFCEANDGNYRRTRKLVLGDANPWFHRGKAAEGIGSPHTPEARIWPIGIIMRAMTSTDDDEILAALRMLAATDADTGFMHEAFDKDDPKTFTRPWFAWANTLYGELILKLIDERPKLLKRA